MQSKNEIIGLTTTVPVEIIIAAGYTPLDLNNIFICDNDPESFVEDAENFGFPGNSCSWIKGIFSAIKKSNTKTVIAPVWGDCSNTHALCEILRSQGIKIIEFAYPYNREKNTFEKEVQKICDDLNCNLGDVFKIHKDLEKVRKNLKEIDSLTIEQKVTGLENHIWLVNSSDFQGNPECYLKKTEEFLEEKRNCNKKIYNKRIGIVGVPPIFTDFYEHLEENNVHVAFNEVQYEFSMIKSLDEDFYTQYLNYSYPYGMSFRILYIKKEIKNRNLDGIIHYTQCFCFRQIEDILLKEELDVPVLTIEGDRPCKVDARTRMRIENFLEII